MLSPILQMASDVSGTSLIPFPVQAIDRRHSCPGIGTLSPFGKHHFESTVILKAKSRSFPDEELQCDSRYIVHFPQTGSADLDPN